MNPGPTLAEWLDSEMEAIKTDFRWEMHLALNEEFHGSAYGPFLPPKPFLGLAALLNEVTA